MGSPPVLDFEALLRPFDGDSPAGEDLRARTDSDPAYFGVKDVRTEARSAERQGLFGPVIGAQEAATWKPLVDRATEILGARSKDLEIAAWLVEALARTKGFAGLRDGFRLVRELSEKFWDGLHPMPDEDGLETRIAPLSGLNGFGGGGTLIAPIARIPLTDPRSVDPVGTWSCRQAEEIAKLEEDARAERIANGSTDPEQVSQAAAESSAEFYTTLLGDLQGALEELALLSSCLDERCGADSPPTSALREALEDSQAVARFLSRDVLPGGLDGPQGESTGASDPEPGTNSADSATRAPDPAMTGAGMTGSPNSREEAFRALEGIAEFFRRTEPHSPLPFLLERAVRWGRLPLPRLLEELIPDGSARDTFAQLTGVQSDTDED